MTSHPEFRRTVCNLLPEALEHQEVQVVQEALGDPEEEARRQGQTVPWDKSINNPVQNSEHGNPIAEKGGP